MPLLLAPVRLEDFDQIEKHADVYEPGDDLVAPPYPVAWPVSTQEEAQSRLRFAMAKQRRRFQEDPTARFVKVVDAPSEAQVHEGEIISIARWHYFPSGYDYPTMIDWELAEQLPGEDWPQGLNRTLHDFILSTRDMERKEWIGTGSPVWILMHMVTRQSHRGRGAAAMLIKWGIAESEKSGAPAYLEAGAQGRPIYAKYGFIQVGDIKKLDLKPYGVGVVFELANMVRYPGRLAT
jgi:GNAT superfamily N-acetyltransferase